MYAVSLSTEFTHHWKRST